MPRPPTTPAGRRRKAPDPAWITRVTDAVIAHNINDFSLTTIGKVLDVTVPALIYQFRTQAALTLAVCHEISQRDTQFVDHVVASGESFSSALTRMAEYFESDSVASPSSLILVRLHILLEACADPETYSDFAAAANQRWLGAFRAMARRDGIPANQTLPIAEFITALLRGSLIFAVSEPKSTAARRTLKMLIDWYEDQCQRYAQPARKAG